MITVEMAELGSTTRPLTAEQGTRLADSGLVKATPSSPRGHWELTARGKVGFVQVGDVQLWIRPKLPIARLLFLAGYAVNPKGWRDDDVTLDTAAGLVPATAQALWRHVERALRPGLLQGYHEVEDTAYVVRGRLRVADQLRRRHGRPLPLELRHDEFTVDIAENRILLAAVSRMLTVPRVDEISRRRLSALRSRLADATTPVTSARLPPWTPTRRNVHYHAALHLAEVIWQATSPEHVPGAVHATGFLLNLYQIFEDFVVEALSDALSRHSTGTASRRFACHLDESATVAMEPDLVWHVAGKPAAVVDAKYKRERPSGHPNDDIYQLLAYCTALGLSRGHLVYAKGNADPARYRVLRSGPELVAHALDLTAPPAKLLAQIDELAQQLIEN